MVNKDEKTQTYWIIFLTNKNAIQVIKRIK